MEEWQKLKPETLESTGKGDNSTMAVIERCLVLWSNPGETVLSPFMGVGSEVCGALLNDRRGIGIELKPSYYRVAKRNIEYVLKHGKVPTKTGSLLPDEESFEEENRAGPSEAELQFPESKIN
jgi:hypothetical protein